MSDAYIHSFIKAPLQHGGIKNGPPFHAYENTPLQEIKKEFIGWSRSEYHKGDGGNEEYQYSCVKILYLAADPRIGIDYKVRMKKLPDIVNQKSGKLLELSGRDPEKAKAELLILGSHLVLDSPEESHAIQSAVEPQIGKGHVKYEKFFSVRAGEIERRIKEITPDIVQLSCHSDGAGLIVCGEPYGQGPARIRIDAFVEMLSKLPRCPVMIVLACCNAEKFAKKIIRKTGVGIVIYGKGALNDSSAVGFSRKLYERMMKGKNIQELFDNLCKAQFSFVVKSDSYRTHVFYAISKTLRRDIKDRYQLALFKPRAGIISEDMEVSEYRQDKAPANSYKRPDEKNYCGIEAAITDRA